MLEVVARDPGDDTAWLALADAVEEQGGYHAVAQAEATRLSLYLRRWPDDSRRSVWKHRVRELMEQDARACLPRQSIALGEEVAITLVLVPPGTFWMGSSETELERRNDEALHQVTSSKGFYLSIHPVTQAQWQAVMGSNPSYLYGDNLPVELVSWDDCQVFCARLGDGFRLPTEVAWEYACRAGTTTAYNNGNTKAYLEQTGWYNTNSSSRTQPVGSKEANAWGLFDMHGNVWEWCSDWYHADYYSKSSSTDPPGPAVGFSRVIRGGGWHSYAGYCRSASRYRFEPVFRDNSLGFRLARDLF